MTTKTKTDRIILKIPGTSESVEFKLQKDKVLTLGREDENTIVVPDKEVSRKHFKIYYEDGKGYIIKDMNSGNGTYINGEAIREKTLKNCDFVRVGSTELRVLLETPESGSPEHLKQKNQKILLTVIAILALIFLTSIINKKPQNNGIQPPPPNGYDKPPSIDSSKTAQKLFDEAEDLKKRSSLDIGNLPKALENLQEALNRNPEAQLETEINKSIEDVKEKIGGKYKNLGATYSLSISTKDYEEAKKTLKEIMKLFPDTDNDTHIWAQKEIKSLEGLKE